MPYAHEGARDAFAGYCPQGPMSCAFAVGRLFAVSRFPPAARHERVTRPRRVRASALAARSWWAARRRWRPGARRPRRPGRAGLTGQAIGLRTVACAVHGLDVVPCLHTTSGDRRDVIHLHCQRVEVVVGVVVDRAESACAQWAVLVTLASQAGFEALVYGVVGTAHGVACPRCG